MRTKKLVPFIPYIVISLVHCVLIIFQLPGRGPETKQLLMPALALAIAWSLWQVRPRGAMLLLLIAATMSWFGDGAGLFFPGLPTLPTMILFFALAHIAYIVLFARTPGIAEARRVPWWACAYAIWYVVLLTIVGPSTGALFVPVAIYGLVLGATAAMSPRLGSTVALGGAFFLLSDTVLALREFLDIPAVVGRLLIMPTYTLGQGLIVFGVVSLLSRQATRSTAETPQAISRTRDQ